MKKGFGFFVCPGARGTTRLCWGIALVAGAALAAITAADFLSPVSPPTLCQSHNGLPEDWGGTPRAGMVRVEGGEFEPGNPRGYPEERPNGKAELSPFWIDRTEVTNAQFAAFVKATGYVTEAEREGAAAVFRAPDKLSSPSNRWWHYTPGANWRQPEGPESSIRGRANHPVVHVTYADARAYARWLGRDLPTEAQWEYAARAGAPGAPLNRPPQDSQGDPAANFWQGNFPFSNRGADGHVGTAPVGCYAPNPNGLFDMVGNVWELTDDIYQGPIQPGGTKDPLEAKQQPSTHSKDSPVQVVIKGGSFLCAPNYCARYRATSRQPQEVDLGMGHVGFRTVLAAD